MSVHRTPFTALRFPVFAERAAGRTKGAQTVENLPPAE